MTMGGRRQLGWHLGTVVCCASVLGAHVGDAHGRPSPRDQAAESGSVSTPDLHPDPAPPRKGKNPSGQAGPKDAHPPRPAGLRKLTPDEINRIRYMELRGMRMTTNQPDRVSVKISRETVEEFLREMEGDRDFRGEKSRRAFRKLTAAQKLHYIAFYKGAEYADRVKIRTDPEVFVTFKRNVLPIILRGCAKPGCHISTSEDAAVRFRLFKDPKKKAPTTYANFITLNDIEVDHRRMIDRGQPERSLLLTYMVPTVQVEPASRHPGTVVLKPVFPSSKAPRLRRIQKWIASLKHPAEDYGVRLMPRPDDDEAEPDRPEPTDPIPLPADADKAGGAKPRKTP